MPSSSLTETVYNTYETLSLAMNKFGERPDLDMDLRGLEREDLERLVEDIAFDVDIPEEAYSSMNMRMGGGNGSDAVEALPGFLAMMFTGGVYGVKMYKETKNSPDQLSPNEAIEAVENSLSTYHKIGVKTEDDLHFRDANQVLDELKEMESDSEYRERVDDGVTYRSGPIQDIRGFYDDQDSMFTVRVDIRDEDYPEDHSPRELLADITEEEIKDIESDIPNPPKTHGFTIIGFNPDERINNFYSQNETNTTEVENHEESEELLEEIA